MLQTVMEISDQDLVVHEKSGLSNNVKSIFEELENSDLRLMCFHVICASSLGLFFLLGDNRYRACTMQHFTHMKKISISLRINLL